jgi:hypothetical protein
VYSANKNPSQTYYITAIGLICPAFVRNTYLVVAC